MKYQLTQNSDARATSYVGTVETTDDADLVAFKENIKRHNKRIRELYKQTGFTMQQLLRVKLQGRGPRAVHAKAEGRYARVYDSHLPKDLATHWDVYVHEDGQADDRMRQI